MPPCRSLAYPPEGEYHIIILKDDPISLLVHNRTDDLFGNDPLAKETFFDGLHRLLEDGRPRYFLPEVNSRTEDLQAIVSDFISEEFEFSNDPVTKEEQKN